MNQPHRLEVQAYQSDEPIVLSVDEACRRLNISKWSLYRLLQSNQLNSVQIGRRRLIPVAALTALLDRLSGKSAA